MPNDTVREKLQCVRSQAPHFKIWKVVSEPFILSIAMPLGNGPITTGYKIPHNSREDAPKCDLSIGTATQMHDISHIS